jgi:hypothetical protein
MRIALFAAAFLVAGTTANFLEFEPRMLQETNSTTVTFAANLACGACVRGGNIFCLGSGAKANKCCRSTTECSAELIDRAYTCSNTVTSQFNRLFKICSRTQSNAVCGKSNVNLQALNATDAINITALPVGQSCSYRVLSKCGFPAFEVTGANIDVTVLKQEGKGETEDVGDSETVPANQVAIPRQVNGKISFNAGAGQSDATCGKMRKLFVTLTNIPPTPESNTTRLLQAASDLTISFAASSGDAASSSASSLFYGVFLVAMSFMMFAF